MTKFRSIRLMLMLIFLLATVAGAQEPTGTVEGVVLIKGTREPLSFAEVSLTELERTETTDEQGRFAFAEVPVGVYTLEVAEDTIGTQTLTVKVQADRTVTKRVYVRRDATVLDDITVIGEREPEAVARQELDKQELTGVPGANNDPVRVIENLPGVAATSVLGFGNDGLIIRGTGAEDSGYKLNGLDIPQLFHFGGFSSIVNAELLEDMVYYPGAYSVKYGDALGGVIELTSREPRTDRLGGLIDLNTYATYMIFEGPIGENASWAGGVRRSFIDFILPEVIPEDEADFTVMPRYYDYQGIFMYRVGTDHQFRLTAFGSDDAMSIVSDRDMEDPYGGDSFNMRISWHQPGIAWTWTPTENLRNYFAANYIWAYQDFSFGPDYKLKMYLDQVQFRDDLSIKIGSWNELRTGFEGDYAYGTIEANVPQVPKEGDPGFENVTEDTYKIEESDDVFEAAVYLEDVIAPAKWLSLVPGVRLNYHQYLNKASFDPRFSFKVWPTEKLAFKGAVGLYHQWPGLDEYIEDYGNEKLDAECSELYSGGVEYDFGNGWSIDAQGYYKQLSSLVSGGRVGEDVNTNDGQGKIHGFEFLGRKKLTDHFMGWVSYTYSESKRKDNADEDWRYFDGDQTHNFIILANYTLGENKDWRVGAKWQYSTGLPYTDIEDAIYAADTDTYIPIYSEDINAERDVPFHKLDVRLDKLWTFNAWQLNTYLDVQNVYWNEYPIGYEYNYDYSKKRAISFPAFMPTIGVQGRF